MKRMKTLFILLAAIAFAGAPCIVHAQQFSTSPNPSGGEIIVTTAQDNSEDFANYGDIELNAALGTGGMLTNEAGATLTIYSSPGTLDINAPSVVIVVSPPSSYTLPGGSLFNNGTVGNYGTVGNADVLYNSGPFTNYTGGILYNGFSLVSGSVAAMLTNNDTLTNNGELYNYLTGDLENNGTLTNTGTGYILNNVGGILNNNSGGILNNNLGSSLVNNGTIGNYGTLTNNLGASLTNSGSIISTGSFTNSGSFYNYGGAFTGAFQSSGITYAFGGTALAPNTFAGTVTNDSGGQFNVGYGGIAGYVTFMNAVTNSEGATFTISKSYVTFEGTVTNNGTWVSDPSTVIFDGIFNGQNGTITGSIGDTYEFLGAGANTINLGGQAITISTLILGQGATLNITDGSLTVNELIDPTGTDSGITGAFTAKSYGIQTPIP